MNKSSYNLVQYAAMAACVINSRWLGAQAVYTDLDPDVIVEMDPEILNIDMNGDGVMDFAFLNEMYTIFTFDSEPQSYLERIWVGPKNPNNAIAGSLNQFTLSYGGLSTYYYPFALPPYTPINGTLEFQTDGYQMMAFRTFKQFGTNWNNGGNWYPEITNHYLGIRFLDTTGCNHYGWIRCDVLDEGRVLVVKDFAYETKCDTAILAGDTIGDTTVIVGVEAPLENLVKIWASGFNIHVFTGNWGLPLYCTVINATGQNIYDGIITQTTSMIPLNQVGTGIYIVTIRDKSGASTIRKIALK